MRFVECIKNHVMVDGTVSHHKGAIYEHHVRYPFDVRSTDKDVGFHSFADEEYFSEFFVKISSLEDYGKPVNHDFELGGSFKYDREDELIKCEIEDCNFAITLDDVKLFNKLIK